MQEQPEARRCEFEAILSYLQLQPGDVVADMPSGGGYCGRYLPPEVSLIAVDESAMFLQAGRHSPQTRAVCAPLHETGLQADSCDAVISLAGLHHIRDKAGFFREALRILRPGGMVVVADAWEGSRTAVFLDGFVHRFNTMGHRGEYFNDAVVAAVEQSGFVAVAGESMEYPWIFPDQTAMGRFCRLLFGLDKAASDSEVAGGIVRELSVTESGGSVKMGWSLCFIRAQKPG